MNNYPLTMIDTLELASKRFPDNVALEFMGKTIKYKQLTQEVDTIAKALIELGVKKDEVVCVAMPNMPQAIIFIYAANKIGAAVNMIHPLSAEEEIKHFVNKVHASTLLVLDDFYSKILHIKNETNLKNIIVASASDELPIFKHIAYSLSNIGKQKPKHEITWNTCLQLGQSSDIELTNQSSENAVALIMHSGGTTGKVKGVCLSNRSVNVAITQMKESTPVLSPDDKFLSVMPIFHGNGLIIGVHLMLSIGASCVLIPRFTPDSYAKDLLKHKCNYMSGVPALFEKLIETKVMQKADLSFLKGIFCGADYLSVELERRLNEFFKNHHSKVAIRQGYGMTEGVVATTLNPICGQKEGSVGKALNGVNVKIVEPGTDKELPVGSVGEIVFSSETNMMHYYNDPEETAISMKRHSDGQEWIHSGDLGLMDEDGFFYFKGRIKRMIVKNGYNIFPNELENVIEGFDMVDRCCIMDVPCGEGSCKIKAFIVLKATWPKDDETKQEIIRLCEKSIAKYAIPKEIQFLDEMPKTLVGKVNYKALDEI